MVTTTNVNGVRDLIPVAFSVVMLVVVVSVGALVVAEIRPTTFDSNTVSDEPHQPANNTNSGIGAGGVTVTVDNPGISVTSETILWHDSSAAANTTLTGGGDNYTLLDASTGQYNMTLVNSYDTRTGQQDKLFFTYTTDVSSNSTTILDTGQSSLQTFADFFVPVVVVVIAALVFALLGVMRRSGAASA